MDVQQFRTLLPEFANTTRYPDSLIQGWIDLGLARVSAKRFGKAYERVLSMFVAHFVVISAINTANPNAIPGGGGGIQSTKSVGSVSVQYDTASISYASAGHWNQTSYGRQFYEASRLFGAGAVQL